MRAFSRIFVPGRLRKDPRYGEDYMTSVVLAVSLRLAALLLIPSLVAVGLVWQESRARSDANRERIAESSALRRELARGFKRADVISCRERESLKAQNREDARETFRNLERTLRLLMVENTPEIQAIARATLQRDLTRNPARLGGCGNLPPKLGG